MTVTLRSTVSALVMMRELQTLSTWTTLLVLGVLSRTSWRRFCQALRDGLKAERG